MQRKQVNYFIVFTVFGQLCILGLGQVLPESTARDWACFGTGEEEDNVFIDSNCTSGEAIAVQQVWAGVKYNTSNCPPEMSPNITSDELQQRCCVPDSNDDCILEYEALTYQILCSGRQKCVLSQASQSQSTGCDPTLYPPFTHYMYMDYYCIDTARVNSMCTSFTADHSGLPFYLWNPDYDNSGSITAANTACSCSIETENCDSTITVYAIDLNLLAENSTCKQTLSFQDDISEQQFTCSDNNGYEIKTLYTHNSNYLKMDLINSAANDGGKIWLGFQSSNATEVMAIRCPAQDRTFCNVSSTISTTSSTTTETSTSTESSRTSTSTETSSTQSTSSETSSSTSISSTLTSISGSTSTKRPIQDSPSPPTTTELPAGKDDNNLIIIIIVVVIVVTVVVTAVILFLVWYLKYKKTKGALTSEDFILVQETDEDAVPVLKGFPSPSQQVPPATNHLPPIVSIPQHSDSVPKSRVLFEDDEHILEKTPISDSELANVSVGVTATAYVQNEAEVTHRKKKKKKKAKKKKQDHGEEEQEDYGTTEVQDPSPQIDNKSNIMPHEQGESLQSNTNVVQQENTEYHGSLGAKEYLVISGSMNVPIAEWEMKKKKKKKRQRNKVEHYDENEAQHLSSVQTAETGVSNSSFLQGEDRNGDVIPTDTNAFPNKKADGWTAGLEMSGATTGLFEEEKQKKKRKKRKHRREKTEDTAHQYEMQDYDDTWKSGGINLSTPMALENKENVAFSVLKTETGDLQNNAIEDPQSDRKDKTKKKKRKKRLDVEDNELIDT